MLNVNEFNFKLNPVKNTITLDLTKKSKRNLLIRRLVPLALSLMVVPVIGVIVDAMEPKVTELEDTLSKDNTKQD